MDNAFVEPQSRSDGPKSEIILWYDADTLNHLAAPGNHVYATIQNDALAGNLTPENIIRADKIFFDLEPSELRLRGSVCGLDAYDVVQSDYATLSIARYGRGVAEADFWHQWGGSMLFGLKNDRGAYSDVIACDQRLPTCTATTSYRGWPVRLTFPNRRICDYPNVVANARRMFDRFYLDETDRSPGQTEQRWRPVAIGNAPR